MVWLLRRPLGSARSETLVHERVHVLIVDNLWRGSKGYLFDGNGKSIIDLDKDFMEWDLHELESRDGAIQEIGTVFHLTDVVADIGLFLIINLLYIEAML